MNAEQAVKFIESQAATYAERAKRGIYHRVEVEPLLRMDAEIASASDDHAAKLFEHGVKHFEMIAAQ